MKWRDIAKLPTVDSKIHESIFRSYNILDKVKHYLEQGCPAKLILELIKETESD